MLKEVFLIIIGLLGLWGSAELLIASSQVMARKLKISDTFIGLTILSIGTTLPELGTHIASSFQILQGTDVSGIALGTNIGSNIFQITIILGIVAFFIKVKSDKKMLDSDYLVMLGAILLLIFFSLDRILSRIEGIILISLYFLYLYKLGTTEKFMAKIERYSSRKHPPSLYIFGIPLGLALLLFFANVVVTNADVVSAAYNVSQSLLGVVVIGFGTALPELIAAIVAVRRKSLGMSIGVLVGSNITNPLFGVGVGALISTYAVTRNIFLFDLPAWFIISMTALLFFWRKLEIEKKEAVLLFIIYLFYIYLRIIYIK